ncbi:protein CHUP1, chloroplastic isoform X2 [Impatiens glandulifera]|uniref:protein CHUP1, chloroplastic isoform X2 n=1 Tax=Impatiens glandulifera TaxID=253017 RepID=UPI001FB05D2D|nr:protein CHUP1, chloroplastic isoform X2 [Impatiens glandulifera]
MAIVEDDRSRFSCLNKELEAALAKNKLLEEANQELRQDVIRLKMQLSALKAHDNERKAMLWKKLQNSIDKVDQERPHMEKGVGERNRHFHAELLQYTSDKTKTDIPKPKSMLTVATQPLHKHKVPPPPPPPPPSSPPARAPICCPPPPPPPPSSTVVRSKSIQRVPQVMEFYRLLMKRDAHQEQKINLATTAPVINPRNMIGEIENRSTYHLAIKSEVETQGEFISFLIRTVATASFKDMSEVESFVKWLDGELACLVDERAVLKHFPQWPERKADALREAAFNYQSLKSLESDILLLKDNPKLHFSQLLRRIQALQDRLEQSVDNIERVRETTSKRYKEFNIPSGWMLNTGVLGQLKLSSLTLARAYMRRVTSELQERINSQDEDLLLQGVRFGFRVHQFAGGFDAETKHVFEELRLVRTSRDKKTEYGVLG